jgi:Nucleotidyl transferase AbiEii toxin, Type IV TA system
VRVRRETHRIVGRALQSLDGEFLAGAKCYFGGGTYQALVMGEHRVSRDIVFLCSSRAGFRALREAITERSLGAIVREPLPTVRDITRAARLR